MLHFCEIFIFYKVWRGTPRNRAAYRIAAGYGTGGWMVLHRCKQKKKEKRKEKEKNIVNVNKIENILLSFRV